MLKIKLKRVGRHKQPYYNIILGTTKKSFTGKIIQKLGTYCPFTKNLTLNKVKFFYYLIKGAYPSNTVRALIFNTFIN